MNIAQLRGHKSTNHTHKGHEDNGQSAWWLQIVIVGVVCLRG